mmetsp:Transcript_4056/g.5973  ORF Transcript_4056/g.5973 Transcript_4056/m.5973 type:complete len:197 (-) Transcript_4056:230-820(-)|eukprot:CAMPEP_0167763656 /NCGR_PEP_ID=MMETSP0110_2-20121227/13517_1 /TAXON_ID=629695 /ORGANISM="Gymnochlora sp., Strain CCMP2014" /LENGTH=196 /DNA_ID=CAMNT_0007650811 /DNA_START=19 /DNA_END=609 /DNA_ORIENTATION=-
MSRKPHYEVRLITIGDSATGKSSLIQRYTKGTFRDERKATVGIDMRIKTIMFGDRKVKVRIWDTAGQEQFKTITRNYYNGAHGILLVYDITEPDSFSHVRNWLKDINEYADENAEVVLVGNKADLENNRKVKRSDGRSAAETNKLLGFYETSALSGAGVEEAFSALVEKAVGKMKPKTQDSAVIDGGQENQKKKCC